MLKYLIFFFALFGVQSASYAIGSDTIGEASSCVLEVKGKRFINGPCPVVFGGDGGLTVGSNGTKSLPFWAMVLPDGDNRASGEGFWNESPGSSHAHSRLGDLTRSGDCWGNSSTRICVTGFKPADSTSTQNNIHQSQSSPLSCVLNRQSATIECDVADNSVRITNVVFNRGNCESPILRGSERQLAEQRYRTLSRQDKETLEGPLGGLIAVPMLLQKGDPLGKLMIDPTRKEYKFGDKVTILTFGCANLLEYTLTVNGTDWTWKTR